MKAEISSLKWIPLMPIRMQAEYVAVIYKHAHQQGLAVSGTFSLATSSNFAVRGSIPSAEHTTYLDPRQRILDQGGARHPPVLVPCRRAAVRDVAFQLADESHRLGIQSIQQRHHGERR